MGRLIEGFWDCEYCGHKKIKGSVRECPNCGRHRDDNVKFYIDGLNYVDEQKAKTINRNPDWLCSYCDAFNSDDVQICPTCGASREDSERNYFEHRAIVDDRKSKELRVSDNNSEINDTKAVAYDHEKSDNKIYNRSMEADQQISKTRKRNINWKNIFRGAAISLAAVAIIALLICLFTPKVQNVTIQDFSWERQIDVEEYVTVDRSDWTLPAGARLKYSQQEIRSYEQVIDHYETKTREYTEQVLDHYETYVSGYKDLGNGYFEEIESERPVYRTETRTEEYQEAVYRDEPIYATKYYYEIDVWQHAFYETTSGNDKDPYWKELNLGEKQREGKRQESYYISVVNDEGEINKYEFEFSDWNLLSEGDIIQIKTNVFGKAEIVTDGD